MSNISITMTEPMRSFVETQTALGGYRSASEYIRQLIRAEQQRLDSQKLERQFMENLQHHAGDLLRELQQSASTSDPLPTSEPVKVNPSAHTDHEQVTEAPTEINSSEKNESLSNPSHLVPRKATSITIPAQPQVLVKPSGNVWQRVIHRLDRMPERKPDRQQEFGSEALPEQIADHNSVSQATSPVPQPEHLQGPNLNPSSQDTANGSPPSPDANQAA